MIYCYCPNVVDLSGWKDHCPKGADVGVKSKAGTKSGQSQRSSDNFKVKKSGNYVIMAPPGVSFSILIDIRWGLKNPFDSTDQNLGRYADGWGIKLNKDNDYYIGAPANAPGDFYVCFQKID